MEAVPRLPMIGFDLRQSAEAADFGPKLKQFIRSHYNEDPDTFGSEIVQLEGLRSSAVRPTKDVDGCATMKRYYCQLHFLTSRFPMHKDGEAAVAFSWKQLNSNSTSSSSDIGLELSSVLYNIGALHSQLGAADNRTTEEGMKVSCSHFQCAAWAFQNVCDEYARSAGLDLSLDLMSFMAKLCLGQAQECILEKSMMGNRKASLNAKVSVQIVDYYGQALKILQDAADGSGLVESAGSKQCKKWKEYLRFKISYYASIALLFQGQQSEEQHKMGERVAFFKAAIDKLAESRKLAKGMDDQEIVNEALNFVQDVAENKAKAATKENEFIYHEEVPSVSSLPDIKGAALVKGIAFDVNDLEVSGQDIFARIVPMRAHESSSLYSEEKAKLLRRVLGMVENRDEELETFLSTLELDDLNKAEGSVLPHQLIDRCAALSAKPDAIKNLVESMNKLSNMYRDVEAMLTEIKEMLSEEELHEKEYQETVGKRPPTIAATDLTREFRKYQEAHGKASESNQTLHKAMAMHVANMKLLSLPPNELVNHIPTVVESAETEAITKELRHLVDKVNEMKQQRIMLSERLRESLYRDDILRQVVTYTGDNIKTLFDNELQKHQGTVSLIEQNLSAQENIIKALKDAYARYGSTRKATWDVSRKRETMISSLISSYDAYEDLLAKSSKGLDFYKKLEVNVSKLLQRVKGTCKVQDEEREQIIKNVKSAESQDPPPTSTLKLKDYLEMKKEFGKLSLDSAALASANAYYKSDQIGSRSWMPGVRPAPVGSEETTDAAAAARMDSYPGYYHQGRDQTWSNIPYSSPQATAPDDRLKYYPPPGETSRTTYATESGSQSMPQDIYPISAYSSVMQNTSSTGYTGPKSNYYNTQNSPSRYINPPNFYSEYSQTAVTSYCPTTVVASSGAATTPKIGSDNQTATPSYPYPASSQPAEYAYADASRSGYAPAPAAATATTTTTYQYPTAVPLGTVAPVTQYGYSSEAVDPYAAASATPPQPYYNYGVADGGAKQYPGYAGAVSSAYPAQESGYPQQSYQMKDSGYVDQYYAAEGSAIASTAAFGYGYQSSQSYSDPYAWQQTYPENPSQHLQSGNESVYTACQTNNYSLTNSDVYQPPAAGSQPAQYYVNRYGSCNGQSEYGLNYGNSATYIQAGTSGQQTTTTFANSDAKSSPSTEHSNVDLLAGLDFSINQAPLVPESSSNGEAEPPAKPQPPPPLPPQQQQQQQQELKIEKPASRDASTPSKDSFVDVEKLQQFGQEVEKYEKFVESLTMKTLNGPTCLDLKWKEISDLQEKKSHCHTIAVARCYPMKNRFPDILPYDDSRVEMPSTKDDYINASFMKGLTSLAPDFILTQAPLPSTYADFWTMVFEQQVEVVVCLLSDAELDGDVYWPADRIDELQMGRLRISLQSSNARQHWIERIVSVAMADTRVTRVVVHLQFTSWPGSSFPESPGPFLSFATECINFFRQQRSGSHPVVVHCTSGVGRTGLLCATIAAILDVQAGRGIPDLVALVDRMCQCRKSCLRDREHLKFAYQAILYHCQDLLMKQCRGRRSEETTTTTTTTAAAAAAAEDVGTDAGSSDALAAALDPVAFTLKATPSKGSCGGGGGGSGAAAAAATAAAPAKKKFTTENFREKKSEPCLDAFNTESEDPLSRLDPLWTMKK